MPVPVRRPRRAAGTRYAKLRVPYALGPNRQLQPVQPAAMHTAFDDATALTAAEDADLRALLEPLQRQAPPPPPAPPPASEPLPGGSKCEYERAVLDLSLIHI